MNERPVNLPPEVTTPEPRFQKPKSQKNLLSPELKIKTGNYLLQQEHRTAGYTEGYLRGMEDSSTMKTKEKVRIKVNHNLNNVQRLLNGGLTHPSVEVQEFAMVNHSIIEGMKSKPKQIIDKKERERNG